MSEGSRDRLLSFAALILGIASYALACYWYLGLLSAAVGLGIVFYHNGKYPANGMCRAGMVLCLVYIGVVLLSVLAMLFYYNMIRSYRK